MSGWLNFNDSLNSIKGQITTFATNVLADDEETEATDDTNDDYKKLCIQKDLEIERLRQINEELQNSLGKGGQSNGEPNDNNWDWTTQELNVEEKGPKENVSHLKESIKLLENEKNDLVNQLEQLDSENQQNLAKIVGIKEKLQDENNEFKDENSQLKLQNKALISLEHKLKKELSDLQNQSKTATSPKDDFQEKYESILKTKQELEVKLNETTKELSVLKSTHNTLKKTFEDTKNSEEEEVVELTEKLKKSESENKIIYSELQKSKEFVKSAELKSQEDAENCQKLAFILDTYEKQVSSLKEELASVMNENNTQISHKEDVEKSCQDMLKRTLETVETLQNENAKLKADLDISQDSEKLKLELEEKLNEISSLKGELNHMKEKSDIHSKNQEIVTKLHEEIDTLKHIIEERTLEKEGLHSMYVNIVTDSFKKYTDTTAPLPNELERNLYENPQVLEFSRQVENIFKLLLEFKQKCETLEKELIEASNEKTKILNEKYEEIEKLIQNSEILSQEIIKKGETIKELESEITNLITSNDVLLSELDSYKNAGLQTISESNEDNLVLLESELENANERIKTLEDIIDSPSKVTQASDTTSNISLEEKVSKKQEDYQELLNSFDELKLDFEDVTYKFNEANDKLNAIESENQDFRAYLEKMKADFENTDYQLSEANFAIDSLKEELDTLKNNCEALQQENKELKFLNMNAIDVKSELNEVKEKWLTEENLRRELEAQIKSVTEKQQNSKVTETSLKLQFDSLNKEYLATIEAKNILEESLAGAKSSIADYENNYTELLQKYDGVLLRCEELSTSLNEKENEIVRIKGIEEQNKTLENMVQEHGVQDADATKLRVLLQEKEDAIKNISINLKNVENQKSELELLTIQQKQELKESVNREVSLQEALSSVESQIGAKENELIELKSTLEKNQQDKEILDDIALQKTEDVDKPPPSTDNATEDPAEEREKLQEEISNLRKALQQSQESVVLLQQQLQELANSRNDLINMVTIKHQESLNYHNEIQRLSDILNTETKKYLQLEAKLVQAVGANDDIAKKSEEIDRLTDQTNFLKEKCDMLTKNLLEEQSKMHQLLAEKSGPSDKEVSLSKQLDRLQSHLLELEEHYTQELLQAEQNNSTLQAKLTDIEQREKNSSTMYTSVSIRANQQVETLQTQLQLLTNQREELRKKMSDAEDVNNKQAAALANLQFVLEQFQKDREKDVLRETDRIRRQITVEKQIQDDLKKEIENLKTQLEESKMGLQAASRLSDQLGLLKKQNLGLKDEVSQLQKSLSKTQQTIHDLTSQTDGKIDKSLIKSLLVGFLSSGTKNNWNKDQNQVLKLIATVLDFNQHDHDKVQLNQPQQGSWLGSILFPQPHNQNMSQESLSQAFVKFLENESKPRVVPSLLGEQSSRPNTSAESSKRTTPRATPSPIVLNEVVLPTFADFGQSRNSSSILKDVLKDNNS